MAKQKGIHVFRLLCVLCFITIGLMGFSAEGIKVRSLLVDTGAMLSLSSPPQIRDEPMSFSPPPKPDNYSVGTGDMLSLSSPPPIRVEPTWESPPPKPGDYSVDTEAMLSKQATNLNASDYVVIPKQTWCVAKPSTSVEDLDDIINYCCTQPGVDCSVIQVGGECYSPLNKISDASVVMNIYYTINGKYPWDCYFKGNGMIVTEDPSSGYCYYKG